MDKIGIYPGTFDPLTFGHIDVIKRSLKIVDKLIIGIADNDNKTPLLSIEERKLIIDSDIKD
ncbi:MAG: adenylyltransferase/cytidyltransferase family protein, partial [Alphaproteobacteria bacterium]